MKLTFIQTGGTIDKDYPHSTKGLAFEIHDPVFSRILEKLNPSFDYEVISALKKDSMAITQEDRAKLKSIIESNPSDKIIITHGTDTMSETAEFLSAIEGKTIVITGAMRPQRFTNTDADINLGMAIATAQTAKPGVYLCMHGLVISTEQIDRNMGTGQYLQKK